MKNRFINLILLFQVMSLFVTTAQVKQLTIYDCIRIGLDNSKNLKISNSKIQSANSKIEESKAGQLPALKFIGGYTRLSDVEPFKFNFNGRDIEISPTILNNYTTKLGLTQPIFMGNRLDNLTKMSELNTEAAREDLNTTRQQLILDIISAYWSYYGTIELNKSISENIKQLTAHYEDIQSFYKNGLATNNDVLKVQVQLSNLKLTKLDAENLQTISAISLNNVLNISSNSEIEPISNPENISISSADLSTSINDAFVQRSDLKGLNLRIKVGETAVKIAEAGWWPQITFGANLYYNRPNQRLMPTQDKFYPTWDLGLNISYDIWNWNTTKYQVAQAEETVEQSKLTLSQVKDGISLEVTSTYLTAKKFAEKIKLSEETIVQAEENFRVTNEKFKTGVAINSELLDAETMLLTSRINLLMAKVDFEVAKAKYSKALGKIDEFIKK